MSLKVPVEVPLQVAAAIHNNGAHDEIHLAGLVVDAMNALPMRLSALHTTPDREMVDPSEDTDSILTPGPSSENESFTLVASNASDAADTAIPSTAQKDDEEFYVEIERYDEFGNFGDRYFPHVTSSTTGAELHLKIRETLPSLLPCSSERTAIAC